MTSLGWVEKSGEGEQLLAGGSYVNPIVLLAHIGTVTSPRVRVLGTTSPKRVQFGGSVGYGGQDNDRDGNPRTEYGDGKALVFEYNFFLTIHTTDSLQNWTDRIWWKLPPGVTWWFDVHWFV